LPAPTRQELVLVLSQIMAKSLAPMVWKEAGHDHR
jgi:hypothetical protein